MPRFSSRVRIVATVVCARRRSGASASWTSTTVPSPRSQSVRTMASCRSVRLTAWSTQGGFDRCRWWDTDAGGRVYGAGLPRSGLGPAFSTRASGVTAPGTDLQADPVPRLDHEDVLSRRAHQGAQVAPEPEVAQDRLVGLAALPDEEYRGARGILPAH